MMHKFTFAGLSLALFVMIVAMGCSGQQGGTAKGNDKAAQKKESEDHSHGSGPNGGTLVDWGGGKYHVEFCMDHKKKQATVYILDSDAKKPAPIKTDKLLLSIHKPSFQIDLHPLPQDSDPKGTTSRFVGTHENFATEQEFAGVISGEVDGKPYAKDFEEKPEKSAKKK